MRDRKLAVRYARALLQALPDARSAEAAEAFLSALSDALQSSSELREVVLNPAVPRSTRQRIIAALAEGRGLPAQVEPFLWTVLDHGRMEALPAITQVFREQRDTAQGIVAGTLTTAVPLSPAVFDRARAALERLSGKKVRLTREVEPALLGGAIARIGSTLYDGSLRTQLSRLKRKMAEE